MSDIDDQSISNDSTVNHIERILTNKQCTCSVKKSINYELYQLMSNNTTTTNFLSGQHKSIQHRLLITPAIILYNNIIQSYQYDAINNQLNYSDDIDSIDAFKLLNTINLAGHTSTPCATYILIQRVHSDTNTVSNRTLSSCKFNQQIFMQLIQSGDQCILTQHYHHSDNTTFNIQYTHQQPIVIQSIQSIQYQLNQRIIAVIHRLVDHLDTVYNKINNTTYCTIQFNCSIVLDENNQLILHDIQYHQLVKHNIDDDTYHCITCDNLYNDKLHAYQPHHTIDVRCQCVPSAQPIHIKHNKSTTVWKTVKSVESINTNKNRSKLKPSLSHTIASTRNTDKLVQYTTQSLSKYNRELCSFKLYINTRVDDTRCNILPAERSKTARMVTSNKIARNRAQRTLDNLDSYTQLYQRLIKTKPDRNKSHLPSLI